MENVFRRHEEKYLISKEQSAALQKVMASFMVSDQFGEYLVQNLYFDTHDWDVIRTSVDRPVYKEKMRMRCYNKLESPLTPNDVFLELKKKLSGIVYKRRMTIPKDASIDAIRKIVACKETQISREMDFYLRCNPVYERVHIAYQRKALMGIENPELRITFDTNMRFRLDYLDFMSTLEGRPILPGSEVILEIKTTGGIPLWLTRALSENGVFPRTFSKYGTCYTNYIANETKGLVKNSA